MVPSRPVFLSVSLVLLVVLCACAPQSTPAPTVESTVAAPSCTAPNIEEGVWTGSFLGVSNIARDEDHKLKTALDLLRAHCILDVNGTPLVEYDAETQQLLLQVGDAVYPIEEWLAGMHNDVVYYDDTAIQWGIFPIPVEEATPIPGKP